MLKTTGAGEGDAVCVWRLVDHQDRTEANDFVEKGRHLPLHRFGYPSDCDTFLRYYGDYKKKIHSFVAGRGGGPLFIHFSMDFCSSLFWPLASGLFMTAFKWKLRLGGWTTKALRRDSGRARGVQVERSITLSIYPSLVAGHLVFSIDLPLFFGVSFNPSLLMIRRRVILEFEK